MSVERRSDAVSSLVRKYERLKERAQKSKKPEASLNLAGGRSQKTDISHLKEFYLQRLSKTEPVKASRLAARFEKASGDVAQPQASGQHVARPTVPPVSKSAPKDIEDLEVMCNNCFNLIRSSEAGNCTGDANACPVAAKAGSGGIAGKSDGQFGLLDLKLQKLRAALEVRLQESQSKVNVMRHLTQLRYHIDTALKWVPGCSEIGALSDHTVQQVKQLTATSRVLAPAVYIFSKRIENVVVQKERELRKAMVQQSLQSKTIGESLNITLDIEKDTMAESVVDVNSTVSELDSDCGTQIADTVITQDQYSADVGNMNDANEYLSLKNEDEQRRWFYSQCLSAKLSCPDKEKARKILISDLYAKVREQDIPISNWIQWIRQQLMPEETANTGTVPSTGVSDGRSGALFRTELDSTTPIGPVGSSMGEGSLSGLLSRTSPYSNQRR